MKKTVRGFMLMIMTVVMSVSMMGCGQEQDALNQVDSTLREIRVKLAVASEKKSKMREEEKNAEKEGNPWSDSEEYMKDAEWYDDLMHEFMEIDAGEEEAQSMLDSFINVMETGRNYSLDMAAGLSGKEEVEYSEFSEINRDALENNHVESAEKELHRSLKTYGKMYGVDIDELDKMMKDLF